MKACYVFAEGGSHSLLFVRSHRMRIPLAKDGTVVILPQPHRTNSIQQLMISQYVTFLQSLFIGHTHFAPRSFSVGSVWREEQEEHALQVALLFIGGCRSSSMADFAR